MGLGRVQESRSGRGDHNMFTVLAALSATGAAMVAMVISGSAGIVAAERLTPAGLVLAGKRERERATGDKWQRQCMRREKAEDSGVALTRDM